MREGFNFGALSKILVKQQRDADGDQHRTQKEGKSDTKEKAHRVPAFGGRDNGRELANRIFLAAKYRAENADIGCHPKFDFVAGLPQQIAACTNHEGADDSEKFRDGYLPRPAVREKN